MLPLLFHITLKDIRPSQNRQRIYTIAVYANKEQEAYSITLFWGRLGTSKQRKVQACHDKTALDKFLISILKIRLKHGYLLVQTSDNVPNYDILKQFEKASLWNERQLKLF